MEAACTSGKVTEKITAIQGDLGQTELTVIQCEPNAAAPPGSNTGTYVQSNTTSCSQSVQPSATSAATDSDTDGTCKSVLGKMGSTEDGNDRGLQLAVVTAELVEVKTEVSVQANDYEIERATGILPARKRFIPLKYRDFRSPDEIEEDDKQDSDYDPEPLIQAKEPKKKRGRGRPRKYPEAKCDSQAGSDSASKKPQMLRTPNGYKCLTCNRVFSQKGNLKVHLITHTDQRPWLCDVEGCNKGFRTKESLRRHKLSHMGIKPFECSECNKKFCSALSLQEHMSRHSNERPYICRECHRSFRQVSCLRRHLLTHSTVMPHTCEMCGRKFSQAIYLRSHMKVHTGEKPFSCDQCNKSFAHASDLTRHKIIHSGSKPYSCSVCSMRFNDPSSRRRHEREHLGTKPYSCHLCSEGFKRASQLRAHLFRRHGGLKEGVEFQIQEGPEPVCYRIELRQAQGEGSEVTTTKMLDLSGLDQKKIVSLIQNLNRNMVVQEVEVASGEVVDCAGTLEGQAAEVIVNGPQDMVDAEQMVLPAEVAAVMENGEDVNGSVIAIAEVEDGEGVRELGSTYQILQGFGGEGEGLGQQVYEVHYHTVPPAESSSYTATAASETASAAPSCTTSSASTAKAPQAALETASTPAAVASSSSLTPQAVAAQLNTEFVSKPDFGSQEYYDWLSTFTEACRQVPVPLDVQLFQKISQVHKTLSDFMASPSGVIADKENFKVLMSISKDLSHILNEHLTCMLHNLSQGESAQE